MESHYPVLSMQLIPNEAGALDMELAADEYGAILELSSRISACTNGLNRRDMIPRHVRSFHHVEERQCDGCSRQRVIVDILSMQTGPDLNSARGASASWLRHCLTLQPGSE